MKFLKGLGICFSITAFLILSWTIISYMAVYVSPILAIFFLVGLTYSIFYFIKKEGEKI